MIPKVTDYLPGAHLGIVCASDNADLVGINLRLDGWSIRDSIPVYLHGRTYFVWLIRAPLVKGKTIVEHVVDYGVGALHIDAVRIGSHVGGWSGGGSAFAGGGLSREGGEARPTVGRWPANVLIDDHAASLIGEGAAYFERITCMADVLAWIDRLLGSP